MKLSLHFMCIVLSLIASSGSYPNPRSSLKLYCDRWCPANTTEGDPCGEDCVCIKPLSGALEGKNACIWSPAHGIKKSTNNS
uniref:Putative secreted protein n=1 Tax=Amblyomma triste TaxID=251400 RepID=A0A023G009_AMBTT